MYSQVPDLTEMSDEIISENMGSFLYSTDIGEDDDLLASSSSDDSSQCYCEDLGENGKVNKRVKDSIETFASSLSELQFKNCFRVNRSTFHIITGLVQNELFIRHRLCTNTNPVAATYILLWYLGNHASFKHISQCFNIDKNCLYNIVSTGVEIFSKMQQYISWPKSDEYPVLSNVFKKLCKINGIIGAVDVSHISIRPPLQNTDKFFCAYHNSHCLAIQGVISFNNKFLDIFLGETSKPLEIWNKSPISLEVNNGLLENYFIVGTNAYPDSDGLVTPFPETQNLTLKQKEFNQSLTLAYFMATKTFGYLKGRFQRLQHNLENKDLPFAVKCIQAACVLHNICMQYEDECTFFVQEEHGFQTESEIGGNYRKRLIAFKSFLDTSSDF